MKTGRGILILVTSFAASCAAHDCELPDDLALGSGLELSEAPIHLESSVGVGSDVTVSRCRAWTISQNRTQAVAFELGESNRTDIGEAIEGEIVALEAGHVGNRLYAAVATGDESGYLGALETSSDLARGLEVTRVVELEQQPLGLAVGTDSITLVLASTEGVELLPFDLQEGALLPSQALSPELYGGNDGATVVGVRYVPPQEGDERRILGSSWNSDSGWRGAVSWEDEDGDWSTVFGTDEVPLSGRASLADWTGDGTLDLVLEAASGPWRPGPAILRSVVLGFDGLGGAPRLLEPDFVAVGRGDPLNFRLLAVSDLTGDGLPDLTLGYGIVPGAGAGGAIDVIRGPLEGLLEGEPDWSILGNNTCIIGGKEEIQIGDSIGLGTVVAEDLDGKPGAELIVGAPLVGRCDRSQALGAVAVFGVDID